jgi:hypothetical protein
VRFRTYLAAVLGALVVVGTGSAGAQSESRPPKTVFKSGSVRQEGTRGAFCWGSQGGSIACTGVVGYDWPRAKRVEAGEYARFRLKRNDRPDRLNLTYWRELKRNGDPRGDGQELNYELVRRERAGRDVWDVQVILPADTGHFYLEMSGRWRDRNDGGEASYWFHLRLT